MVTPTYPYKPPYPLEIPEEFWILWWSQRAISPTQTDQPYVSGRWYVRNDAVRAAQDHRKAGHPFILLRRSSTGIVAEIKRLEG